MVDLTYEYMRGCDRPGEGEREGCEMDGWTVGAWSALVRFWIASHPMASLGGTPPRPTAVRLGRMDDERKAALLRAMNQAGM